MVAPLHALLSNETQIRDQTVSGRVVDIRYSKEGNAWRLFKIQTADLRVLTCSGECPELRHDMEVKLIGHLEDKGKFGYQFVFDTLELPKLEPTIEGIRAFLQSGIVPGIDTVLAVRITDHFRTVAATLAALRNPELLKAVYGIGDVRADEIVANYQQIEHMQAFLTFCGECGLKTKAAISVWEEYGDDAIEKLRANPYVILEIAGVGWESADALARGLLAAEGKPFDENSPDRISAAIGCGLKAGTWALGNTFMFEEELTDELFDYIDRDATTEEIERAAMDSVIVKGEPWFEEDIYYPHNLYTAETGIVNVLGRMLANPAPLERADSLSSGKAALLDPIQACAVKNALQSRVSYITGKPGTGKSFLLATILEELAARSIYNILLCAPTGKAAKRMAEATHYPASTIHRALGWDDGRFIHNRETPLPYRVVVMDEASMADTSLFYHVVDALGKDARLIIVGDVNQLPSIGPGCVLADIIDSGVVPGVMLEHIYRHGEGSSIPVLADSVLHFDETYLMPDLPDFRDGCDASFIAAQPNDLGSHISSLIEHDLARDGFGPDDIQVISPVNATVKTLNKIVRQTVNPAVAQRELGHYRPGDRVMQIKNCYGINPGIDVFNGDQGKVLRVGDDGKILIVDIEGTGEVVYTATDLVNLRYAYAITVHKSQGAQYPVVAVGLLSSHGRMLNRRLLYTAITRASKKVIVAGSLNAFQTAVRTDFTDDRRTLLMERLRELPTRPRVAEHVGADGYSAY